ncbi:hypothetical protein M1M21_gp53 [Flavobacterium phage vB_FspP_elemoC_14-1A]|jgi:hypothetical protein|uniref:Uncharacterized protein n=2 Tax=Elemovirus TaxID=2948694 RepID=A0A7D7F100_9CAUD|nr:hypothetical protein M1M19_gp53 [Flavobacterium phage vB_FspP_elemoB_14-3B]YP_010356495.1 hypothetical protein M1M21_gp53 [Flavobacterium phage vB_FspP_elemoC_14-1A]QMP85130.1 hypothetical protein elemo25C_phanotate58 [Flavobacterium phage vB_FspP_elemoA_2-5C]QMP88441.1 hypothetical protein elemo39B_phanotate58 [Flavobacterium phage vB_FspP_elemoC_3-9B]QMP84857.1 hypothetical protein elemo141A_phanotate57 [Flavobacterium phage vB_FspP_elemoC_14-1A]QMP84950.1 hypothetical protein elemo143B_p
MIINNKTKFKLLGDSGTPSDTTKVNKVKALQDKKDAAAKKIAEIKENRRKLDSVAAIKRAEIVRKKDSIIQRNANARGMDVSTYKTTARKENKKEDQPSCDTADPNFKSTKCGTSKAASKQSKKEWSKK